jgi:hypothetical protein
MVRSASDAAMLPEGKKSVLSSDHSAETAELAGGAPAVQLQLGELRSG